MRGPIDYIIVGFSGNKFTGEILEELENATSNDIIKVLDLAVITRDEKGDITALELSDSSLLPEKGGLIDDKDVQEVGELLEDNTSAGLLIIEHIWAKGLKQAILNAGGVLLNDGRIHPDASKELDEEE